MRIYISGPITGHDLAAVEQAFNAAEAKIMDRGHETINPFQMSKVLGEGLPWETYMRCDIPRLTDCDAIYLLPGWIYSKGCNLEYDIARQMGLYLFDDMNRIPYTPKRKRERKAYSNRQNKQ